MKEAACQFGDQDRLHGVLTLPDGDAAPATAFVLVSGGFMSKPGPYRLYRQLAHHLSTLGICTLRFDLGGIGNSEQVDPGLPLAERTRIDIRDAVDFVELRLGNVEFVLGGLCSGAEDSFRYAAEDARVSGVVMIDPHAYLTPGWKYHNLFSRHFFNRVIYKLMKLTKRLNLGEEAARLNRAEGFEGQLINYQYMPEREARGILETLIARGVRLHYIYTAGRIDTFNHREQFYRMFRGIDFGGLETVSHLPDTGHVQVFAEDRERLAETISAWFGQHFAARGAAHS